MYSLAHKIPYFVDSFNAADQELYAHAICNKDASKFLERNIPRFECPDEILEEIYYYRWWTYRKHIRQTDDGFIITEFLPDVPWAGKHNAINCAAGHHIYEGRWLHDARFLNDYFRFWLRKHGNPRHYSCWIADSLWKRSLVTGNIAEAAELLPELVANHRAWESTHRDRDGLFWQIDNRDGMERSVGGSGYRATINSYMFGDARAIAHLARMIGKDEIALEFLDKADEIKRLVQERLWDERDQFFKTVPREPGARRVEVRELHGFTPWYFNLPDRGYESAWKQLMDAEGFYAPFGPTTAERRSPGFKLAYAGHECQWNGPSWPYATSITLTAMANLLNDYDEKHASKHDYFELLQIYARSQFLKREDGAYVPWIDENLNPLTGDWMTRTILKSRPDQPILERGKDYNHSTFCDLIITGLVGLRPRADDVVEINPLLPEGAWKFFCLDNISYHGHTLSIVFDKDGDRYNVGPGLTLLIDGKRNASVPTLGRLTGKLPARSPAPLKPGA